MTFESLFIPDVKQLEPGGDSSAGKQIVRNKTLFILPLSITSSRSSRRQMSMSFLHLRIKVFASYDIKYKI